MSLVRCGTCLYRFLIFAFSLTLFHPALPTHQNALYSNIFIKTFSCHIFLTLGRKKRVLCRLMQKFISVFFQELEAKNRVKSGNFGHQVNSDIHLQTVEIQMRRLLMSRLIRIFTVCLVNLFFISIVKI